MPDETTETTELDDAQAALDEARRRVAEVPPEVVIANHAMGLYELAAIHLSTDPPDLSAARLAIDAVHSLVEGVGDRLGTDAETLRAAVANIQMAFVSVSRQHQDVAGDAVVAGGEDAGDAVVDEPDAAAVDDEGDEGDEGDRGDDA